MKNSIKRLINKDEEQKSGDRWAQEDNDLPVPTTTQTAEEIKFGLTETEPRGYKKGRLRLNPKKKQFPGFEHNCLSPEKHDELWNIVIETLNETKKEMEKINERINFQENLLDPGNIEEEEQYLENTRWMLRQEMNELKTYLFQPGKLESLVLEETKASKEG